MKIKTSELTGKALDWAVMHCLYPDNSLKFFTDNWGKRAKQFSYSTDWAQGGPIIEREEIALQCCYADGELVGWQADSKKLNEDDGQEQYGPTALIAAMRCFVASKLGDEVDVPEQLVLKPCRSPYCECQVNQCSHPGFYDARGTKP